VSALEILLSEHQILCLAMNLGDIRYADDPRIGSLALRTLIHYPAKRKALLNNTDRMQAVTQMQALTRSPVAAQRAQQPRCRATGPSRSIVRPRTFLMTRRAQPTVRPPSCKPWAPDLVWTAGLGIRDWRALVCVAAYKCESGVCLVMASLECW